MQAPTIVDHIRARRLDADLAALLWFLGDNRVPVHVVPLGGELVAAIRELCADSATVTDGPGASIEDVLRQPVPLRPSTGVVVVTGDSGRVVAAHLLRSPLRDGAGHVRPQGPGVLAAWLESEDRLEHFAWGVMPEIAAQLGSRRAGELEADVEGRAAFLRALVTSGPGDAEAVRAALRSWHQHAHRAT